MFHLYTHSQTIFHWVTESKSSTSQSPSVIAWGGPPTRILQIFWVAFRRRGNQISNMQISNSESNIRVNNRRSSDSRFLISIPSSHGIGREDGKYSDGSLNCFNCSLKFGTMIFPRISQSQCVSGHADSNCFQMVATSSVILFFHPKAPVIPP